MNCTRSFFKSFCKPCNISPTTKLQTILCQSITWNSNKIHKFVVVMRQKVETFKKGLYMVFFQKVWLKQCC